MALDNSGLLPDRGEGIPAIRPNFHGVPVRLLHRGIDVHLQRLHRFRDGPAEQCQEEQAYSHWRCLHGIRKVVHSHHRGGGTGDIIHDKQTGVPFQPGLLHPILHLLAAINPNQEDVRPQGDDHLIGFHPLQPGGRGRHIRHLPPPEHLHVHPANGLQLLRPARPQRPV